MVSVPATSANLGPGFDALGLALSCRDVVEARVARGGLEIAVTGAGQEAAGAGEAHLVVRAMRAGFAALGGQPPGLSLRCFNAIPQGYGLGSSAAAVVAGLLAARALAGTAGAEGLPEDAVLRLAAQLDGHPDNVSACLGGGLTISWISAAGPRFARLDPVPGLAPVICLPPGGLATATARQLLPASVPHADAAANAARAALLVAALTGEPALLMDATQDYLHQPYRAAAMPDTAGLIGRLRAAGIPAVISGAGPAVLALTVAGRRPGPEAVAALAAGTGASWRVLPLAVDREGATVVPAGQLAAPQGS